MINSKQIQALYNDFYVQIRKYVWPLSTVELLVDFEIECYKAFPDINKLSNLFNKLKFDIKSTANDDVEFQKMIDKVSDFLSENLDASITDNLYYKLNRVREVI